MFLKIIIGFVVIAFSVPAIFLANSLVPQETSQDIAVTKVQNVHPLNKEDVGLIEIVKPVQKQECSVILKRISTLEEERTSDKDLLRLTEQKSSLSKRIYDLKREGGNEDYSDLPIGEQIILQQSALQRTQEEYSRLKEGLEVVAKEIDVISTKYEKSLIMEYQRAKERNCIKG